jgi:hypothetical protein
MAVDDHPHAVVIAGGDLRAAIRLVGHGCRRIPQTAFGVRVTDLGSLGLGVTGVELLHGEVAADRVGHAAFHDQETRVAERQSRGEELIQPRRLLLGRIAQPWRRPEEHLQVAHPEIAAQRMQFEQGRNPPATGSRQPRRWSWA